MKHSDIVKKIMGFLLMAAIGCATYKIETPKNFVVFKKTGCWLKTVAADNSIFALRTWKNKHKGELNFWKEVVIREMKLVKGYIFVKESALTTNQGQKGMVLQFQATSQGITYNYLLALFVTRKKIYAIEATGTEKYFPRHESAVVNAIKTFEPRGCY